MTWIFFNNIFFKFFYIYLNICRTIYVFQQKFFFFSCLKNINLIHYFNIHIHTYVICVWVGPTRYLLYATYTHIYIIPTDVSYICSLKKIQHAAVKLVTQNSIVYNIFKFKNKMMRWHTKYLLKASNYCWGWKPDCITWIWVNISIVEEHITQYTYIP